MEFLSFAAACIDRMRSSASFSSLNTLPSVATTTHLAGVDILNDFPSGPYCHRCMSTQRQQRTLCRVTFRTPSSINADDFVTNLSAATQGPRGPGDTPKAGTLSRCSTYFTSQCPAGNVLA